MICKTCSFSTDRLIVGEWHSLSTPDGRPDDLAQVVTAMLTEPVTRTLPTAWQGDYTVSRAREWIRERDQEGTTLLVIEKSTKEPVGLVILIEVDSENTIDGIEIRLGYLLSEPAWGRGLATELVKGFVGWCRTQAPIATLAGGVDADHPASMRVLEKNGFRPVEADTRTAQDHRLYRLRLR
jgi:RimJ/RimL family protein N-acetyltransferase